MAMSASRWVRAPPATKNSVIVVEHDDDRRAHVGLQHDQPGDEPDQEDERHEAGGEAAQVAALLESQAET